MDDPLAFLFFFLLFNFLGACGIGFALRRIVRRQWDALPIFFLVWGAVTRPHAQPHDSQRSVRTRQGFGGIPLFRGALFFIGAERPAYFLVQLAVMALTLVGMTFVPAELLEAFGTARMGRIVIGSILLIVGGGILVLNLNGGISLAPLAALGLIFVGMILLLTGVISALRPDA